MRGCRIDNCLVELYNGPGSPPELLSLEHEFPAFRQIPDTFRHLGIIDIKSYAQHGPLGLYLPV